MQTRRRSERIAARKLPRVLRPHPGRRRDQGQEAEDHESESVDSDTETDDATEDQYEEDDFVVPDSASLRWAEDATRADRRSHARSVRRQAVSVRDELAALRAAHRRIQMSNEQAFRTLFETQARRTLGLPLTRDLAEADSDQRSRPALMCAGWTQLAEGVLRSSHWTQELLTALRERPYVGMEAADPSDDGTCEMCTTWHRFTHATRYRLYMCETSRISSGTFWVGGGRCVRRAMYYHAFYQFYAHMRVQVVAQMHGMAADDEGARYSLLAALMGEGGACDRDYARLLGATQACTAFMADYNAAANKQV